MSVGYRPVSYRVYQKDNRIFLGGVILSLAVFLVVAGLLVFTLRKKILAKALRLLPS